MAKDYAKKFYNSKQWKRTRNLILKSNRYKCRRCNGYADIVHHIEHITPNNIDDPKITLGLDNLEPLCQDCHNAVHGGSSLNCGYKFTSDGDLIFEKN